jgi:hypothetical protein
MKITNVQSVLVTARWVDDPSFPKSLHAAALIHVTTDAGIDGWGEATLGYFAPETVEPIVNYFKPIVIGRDPLDIAALEAALLSDGMWWARSGAGRSVISGIETALWDLKGKALNVPVYQLLGGLARERIPVYASGGPSMWPIEQNVRKVEFYRTLGHTTAKLSTGLYEWNAAETAGGQRRLKHVDLPHAQRVDKLVEALEAVRSKLGADMDLAVDGHQGGVPHPISVVDAVAFAAALEPFGLSLLRGAVVVPRPRGLRRARWPHPDSYRRRREPVRRRRLPPPAEERDPRRADRRRLRRRRARDAAPHPARRRLSRDDRASYRREHRPLLRRILAPRGGVCGRFVAGNGRGAAHRAAALPRRPVSGKGRHAPSAVPTGTGFADHAGVAQRVCLRTGKW